MPNPLADVQRYGQSLGYDNIRRSLVTSGGLQALYDWVCQLPHAGAAWPNGRVERREALWRKRGGLWLRHKD